MKKKIIHLLLILSTVNVIKSQTIKVNYTDITSLNAPGANIKAFNSVLYINNKSSLYVTQIDSLENGRKRIVKTFKNNDGSISGVRAYSFPNGAYNIINRTTNTLHSNARFNLHYDYVEPLPKINWKITSMTKSIEGINVQKATCKFRGRNYVAWFSTEIPIPLGPWKLNGLPGLIIEAYDTNKEILFLFKKLEYPYKKKINFPSLDRPWNNKKAFLSERKNHIKRNLKYSRAIGQQFDSKTQSNEEEKIKKSSFIELEY